MQKLWIMIAAVAAAAAVPGVANAIVCYTLLDKGDNVLYQDSAPPIDMSDSGAALRRGMRQRNEYLMIYEVDTCPPVVAVAGSTGYRAATVDEIVSGMRAYATHPRLQNLRRHHLVTKDAHGLYAQFGFATVAKPESHMEKRNPDVYKRAK